MSDPPVLVGATPGGVIVGIFIHNYRWGLQIRGDERGYIEKVKRYREAGVEFFTIEKSPSMQDAMGEKIYNSLVLDNCPVPPKNIRQLVIISILSLRASIRRYPTRPMAIYAYNQDIENLWTAYLLKILLRAPLVVVYHQIRPAAFISLREGTADRLRRGFNPVSAIIRSILPSLNRFAARHADVHIALAQATKADVKKYLGIKDCSFIPNGLDTVKFRPLDLPKKYDAAFLGRLAQQKGIDVLLRAWKIVIDGGRDRRLVLLGGGEPGDILMYKRMAEELNLGGNVEFRGFVSDEDLVRGLNSSRLFVFPSRQEGFAQSVSQAMGCGLCCVLSDITTLRRLYGEAAMFFPPEQPAALAETVTHLLEADEERTEFAKKARRLAERFSWEETVGRELELIRRPKALDHEKIEMADDDVKS